MGFYNLGKGEFIVGNGVVQAAFLGILLPVGYLVGKKLAARTPVVLAHKPLYYATSAAAICFCRGNQYPSLNSRPLVVEWSLL